MPIKWIYEPLDNSLWSPEVNSGCCAVHLLEIHYQLGQLWQFGLHSSLPLPLLPQHVEISPYVIRELMKLTSDGVFRRKIRGTLIFWSSMTPPKTFCSDNFGQNILAKAQFGFFRGSTCISEPILTHPCFQDTKTCHPPPLPPSPIYNAVFCIAIFFSEVPRSGNTRG